MSLARVMLSELKRMTAGILPKLVLLAMASIPLLYGGIYLFANWDPYGNVDEVKAALVMLDEGAENSTGEQVNTGQEVKKNLLEADSFDWHEESSREQVVEAVTKGDYDFALVIPADFSQNLQSTASFAPDENGNTGVIDPQAAGLEVITNDANNYILTNIVTKAGTTVRDTVASQVGEKTANTLLASFTKIHSNLGQAADGSSQLASGSLDLNQAISQVKDGTATLSDGTITLKDGTGQLASGSSSLLEGQQKLADGSSQLASGAQSLKDGAASANSGAAQLAEGAQTLKINLETAAVGAQDLADGAQTLLTGSQTLASGTQTLADGSQQLKAGTQSLADGATSLASATSQLDQTLQSSQLSELSSGLKQVCANLASDSTSEGAASLSDAVTAQLAQNMTAQLAPLVQAGSLSQEQADALVANLKSDSTKTELTQINQQAFTKVGEQLSTLGSSCADGNSTVAGDIDSLLTAVNQINSGASNLSSGASTLNEKMGDLASGATSVNQGAQSLSQGASSLASGAQTLASGASQLSNGSSTLADGATSLADGSGQLASATSSLADASGTLASGQSSALEGQKALSDGIKKVDDGASSLVSGSSQLDSGLSQVAAGSSDLEEGAKDLETGLTDGIKQIPSLNESDQNKVADTMSNPVSLNHTSLANGANYGEGMGPFFMVLALWIGALMLVQTMRSANNRALASAAPSLRVMLGSWGPFAVLGFLQALLLFAVVKFALGFSMAHPWLLFWFLVLVALVYTAIIYGLVALFEAPGKLLALVILILQLVTAGGMMPYETLPTSIQWMHHILPMGYALSGARRLAYGIDTAALGTDLLVLILWGILGLALGFVGTVKNRTWNLKKLNPEITV